MSALIFQLQSTVIVVLLILGSLQAKKNRRLHVRMMSLAIAWDIILILQIELTRHAVEKAITINNNSAILNIHVLLAITTVILYGIMIFLGRKILQGNNSLIPRHKKLGLTTLVIRILTYITSYMAV